MGTEKNREQVIPWLIAHRGYARCYPENTLPAIVAAVEAGACWIEVDIQFSRDLEPVLLHDDNLLRVAGLNQSVFATGTEELLQISVGERDRLGDEFTNVKPLLLTGLLEYANRYPAVNLLLEIKEETIDHFGMNAVIERLQASLPAVSEQLMVICYDPAFLERVRQVTGSRVGLVLRQWDEVYLQQAEQLQPEMLICNYRKIPEGFVSFRDYPWAWALYEIVDPEMALRYAVLGVDYIETMDIGGMLQNSQLARRSCTDAL